MRRDISSDQLVITHDKCTWPTSVLSTYAPISSAMCSTEVWLMTLEDRLQSVRHIELRQQPCQGLLLDSGDVLHSVWFPEGPNMAQSAGGPSHVSYCQYNYSRKTAHEPSVAHHHLWPDSVVKYHTEQVPPHLGCRRRPKQLQQKGLPDNVCGCTVQLLSQGNRLRCLR